MTSTGDSPRAAGDIWTVRRILEWTAEYLKQRGIESPRLESELLLAHARRCQRIRLYTDFEEPLSDQERATMRELVQQRARRVPLAYLVGSREFYGKPFDVAPGVLIPRPETETLVDVALECLPRDEPRRVVEVGIGSGCIAVTIARLRPLCRIVATEISAEAAEIAQRNAVQQGVADRVEIRIGSGLDPVVSDEPFDGIVSNPPYIRDDERASLAPEVAEHEPARALFAGADGLDVVRLIAGRAAACLVPGGFIAMELDPSQCTGVGALLLESGFQATTVRKDLSGNDRVVTALKK